MHPTRGEPLYFSRCREITRYGGLPDARRRRRSLAWDNRQLPATYAPLINRTMPTRSILRRLIFPLSPRKKKEKERRRFRVGEDREKKRRSEKTGNSLEILEVRGIIPISNASAEFSKLRPSYLHSRFIPAMHEARANDSPIAYADGSSTRVTFLELSL